MRSDAGRYYRGLAVDPRAARTRAQPRPPATAPPSATSGPPAEGTNFSASDR